MSTNFYLVPTDSTAGSGDPRALHVLKRASGYTIAGHRGTPFGDLSSWADWRAVLSSVPRGWGLRDEYESCADAAALVADVDAWDEQRRIEKIMTDTFLAQQYGVGPTTPGPDGAWKNIENPFANRWHDAEGYLVVGSEFC